jgi:hypothetical protein
VFGKRISFDRSETHTLQRQEETPFHKNFPFFLQKSVSNSIMDATTSWINNDSAVTSSSSSSNLCLPSKVSPTDLVVSKPSQALIQSLKPLPRHLGGISRTRSTTLTKSLSSTTSTCASLVQLKLELTRSKSLGHTNSTTTATIEIGCETDWKNDLERINNLFHKNSKKDEEQEEDADLSHIMTNGEDVTEFHEQLRDSASNWYDSIDVYQRGLLLDSPNFLQHQKNKTLCCDGDCNESDDMVDFDFGDDIDSDIDDIDWLTFMVEHQMPLRDGSTPKMSFSHRNDVVCTNRREFFVDRRFYELARFMGQLHRPAQGRDDLLSQGDLESYCYDEESDDDYDDEVDDSSFSSSESDCCDILGMRSCE